MDTLMNKRKPGTHWYGDEPQLRPPEDVAVEVVEEEEEGAGGEGAGVGAEEGEEPELWSRLTNQDTTKVNYPAD